MYDFGLINIILIDMQLSCFAVAIIGFQQQEFIVAEGDQLSIPFSVLFGQLDKEVDVLFSVVSDTANGTNSVIHTHVYVYPLIRFYVHGLDSQKRKKGSGVYQCHIKTHSRVWCWVWCAWSSLCCGIF